MPVFKYFMVVGSALLALLFVSDAYFGEAESRFDRSYYEGAIYTPRLDDLATQEARFTRDVTPANRVKDVFAQFVPNEAKRAKRSSAVTVIR